MSETTLRILVTGTDLPGRKYVDPAGLFTPVFVGIQKGKEIIDLVPGDADVASFTPEFRVKEGEGGKPNFLGPFAQGRPEDRFFYLVWCVLREEGRPEMFRRLKVRLGHIGWDRIEKGGSSAVEVHLRLTDCKGGPLCATPPPSHIEWRI